MYNLHRSIMFEIQYNLFTQIIFKHFNKMDTLLSPINTKQILHIFNQTNYKKNSKSKYDIMTYYIYKSSFVHCDVENDVSKLFNLAQRTYYGLTRLALLWKQKRISSNTTDLILTPLSNYKEKSLLTLYENGKPYTFHLPDLYNIIDEALTHCSHDYFLELKLIKNPYTNIPFKLHNIYNIYIAYYYSTFTIPILFRGFIENDCNINKFMNVYEPIIRDNCINKYFNTISNYKCVKEIRKMLYDDMFNTIYKLHPITIHRAFPWDNLIYHFKPYAKLYHKAKYGLNPYSKCVNKTLLLKKMKLFIMENPRYGRKFVNPKYNHNSTIFTFGVGNLSTFDTSVKTHFNDMTSEKLKNISSVNRHHNLFNNTGNNSESESESESENENENENENIAELN